MQINVRKYSNNLVWRIFQIVYPILVSILILYLVFYMFHKTQPIVEFLSKPSVRSLIKIVIYNTHVKVFSTFLIFFTFYDLYLL